MTFLPIIERELRVRARSRATYWSRFAVALTGALIGLPSLFSSGPFSSPAATGQAMFNSMVSAAFLLSCAGCLLTADTISSERREGTLGLLLLTRVRDRDVLIGKLGSAGLTSLCALVAFLPILMLPILAGGVTGGEAFRKGLVLLDTLFLALAAGLWASARGHEWLKTGRNALMVVASVVLGPLLAGALLFGKLGAAGASIKFLSPLGTLSAAKDVLYNFSGTPYWLSLLVVQALGWLLLAGAVFRLRRGWREEREATAGPALATVGESDAEAATPSCTPLDDDTDPLVWLLQRRRGLRSLLWAAALTGLSLLGDPASVPPGALDLVLERGFAVDAGGDGSRRRFVCLGGQPFLRRGAAHRRTRASADHPLRREAARFDAMGGIEACSPVAAGGHGGAGHPARGIRHGVNARGVWPVRLVWASICDLRDNWLREHHSWGRGALLGGIVVRPQGGRARPGDCLDSDLSQGPALLDGHPELDTVHTAVQIVR